MSRIHDALQKSQMETHESAMAEPESIRPANVPVGARTSVSGAGVDSCPTLHARISPDAHLVALGDPLSLAAEKFRVLAARLDNIRTAMKLKCLQVTSATVNDGKTLMSANLAVTLASRAGSKVLLVEGDLHKPVLAQLFGWDKQPGLTRWWSETHADIAPFIQRLEGMPLWMLMAEEAYAQPSDIWRSTRFAKAFAELVRYFDWVVVDCTPLLPTVDVNLWSRLVDGTLLVVREGMTPLQALKKGLQTLDDPKIIGVVLNEASEFDRVNSYDRYYAAQTNGKNGEKKQTKPEGLA